MNLAEQLFFRYTPGDVQKYSTETLLQIADDVFRFGKILARHSEKFILFLSELPDHIFSYYLRHVGFDIVGALDMTGVNLQPIFEDTRILKRKQHLPAKGELYNELHGLLLSSLHTSNVQILDGNTLAIGVTKNDAKHNFSIDLLLSCHEQQLHMYQLSNEFKKETKGYHPVYDEHLSLLQQELQSFQEKNRLHLLYV